MSQAPGNYSSRGPSRPPASIPELAERALDNLWDDNANLKHYLRTAEKFRREGKELAKQGDIEAAFVLLAKAATLVLEKLPTHRDYQSLLNQEQKNNLVLNGQDILDHLGELKKALLERYDDWHRRHPDGQGTPNGKLHTTLDDRDDPSPRSQADINTARFREEEETRARLRDQHQRAAEEARLWRDQREEAERRDAETRNRKREAAAAAARQAAHAPIPYASQHPGYNPEPNVRQQQQQQDEFRRREEDIRRRAGDQRRDEQDDIIRRQQAADEKARSMRHNVITSTPSGIPVTPINAPVPSSGYFSGYPSLTPGQSPVSAHPIAPYPYTNGPSIMPLENPSGYDGDQTDTESVHRFGRQRQPSTPSRAPVFQSSQPVPITTTSPPPRLPIGYPQLMSPHQQRQGYYPSLNSMFMPTPNSAAGGSMLFDSRPGNDGLYNQNMLPPASAPVHVQSYNQPSYQQHSQPSMPMPPMPASALQYPSYPGPSRPPPPVPVPSSAPPASKSKFSPGEAARISKDGSRDDTPSLKTVSLPRECLPRFIAIAKVNTANNKETCGLLLGKDKGHKFAVTTLLIPKQKATSDTCTMEEEELVLQFTEERSLITLGWIHTHPSQSCFMSSVDLHTHSGFQRMLPESFAVVCAPSSSPNFGIFRLTDPPGLNTILSCSAKEAFHPHPDLPIYTDADKGHVQMKSGNLEIVDLR